MTNHEHHLPPVPFVYGLSIISFSMSLFFLLNHLIKKFTANNTTTTLQKQHINNTTTILSNNDTAAKLNNNNTQLNNNNTFENDTHSTHLQHRYVGSRGGCHGEDGACHSNGGCQDNCVKGCHGDGYSKENLTNLSTPIPRNDTDVSWRWRNLFISWMHAFVVGVWDLTCFYYYPELTSDPFHFHNPYIYSLVSFSTGYFIYDCIVILWGGKVDKIWEVVPHHFAVVSTFLYNVIDSSCLSYCVVALLTEVNTTFLHSRKLLQMHGVSFDHTMYRINSVINLTSFVVCRFGVLAWLIAGVHTHRRFFASFYMTVLVSALFVMCVTNVLLFWRLVKSDVVRPVRAAWKRSGGGGGGSGGGGGVFG